MLHWYTYKVRENPNHVISVHESFGTCRANKLVHAATRDDNINI